MFSIIFNLIKSSSISGMFLGTTLGLVINNPIFITYINGEKYHTYNLTYIFTSLIIGSIFGIYFPLSIVLWPALLINYVANISILDYVLSKYKINIELFYPGGNNPSIILIDIEKRI